MNADLRGLVYWMRQRSEEEARDGEEVEAAIYRECAGKLEACLSVAQGQGFVMVPRVPTQAMIEAGARYGVDGDFDTDLSNGVKDLSRRLAAGAYTAMLAAAPAQPDGVDTYQSATNSAGIGSCGVDAAKGGEWKEWAELDRFVEEAREAFLGHPSSGIFRAIGKKLSAMTTPPAQAAEAVEGSLHFASPDCWCKPELASDGVWLHKTKEGQN